ncbi:hypothetical protein B4N89_14180 [Embleya scabrispora]|uniref:Uncharacterized protein n=1 Tax=Embleya scabrispora TaxID=159449 RepID=A0A1T3NYM1_9ACTN|nr:hypothetical protein B4N89_14180 [Embleya scabrispora]
MRVWRMDPTAVEQARRSDERLTQASRQAQPVWESSHDHDAFRRFLDDQGWGAALTIAVIRRVLGCELKDAMDVYDSYCARTREDVAGS